MRLRFQRLHGKLSTLFIGRVHVNGYHRVDRYCRCLGQSWWSYLRSHLPVPADPVRKDVLDFRHSCHRAFLFFIFCSSRAATERVQHKGVNLLLIPIRVPRR